MSDVPRSADALTALNDIRLTLNQKAEPFDGGEHMWLGNEGARRAIQSRKCHEIGPLRRAKDSTELTYGEIVALSGDFYESPDALFDETPSPLPWLWETNDLSDLHDIFAKELAWGKVPPANRASSYPKQVVALWWNAKQYVELALRNDAHFGWHNMKAYVRHHQRALELAAEARATSESEAKSLLWRRALFTNGFADHFLTDGFAAGHVRTPSSQIRAWATHRGESLETAGMLVKLIHDQDGHVSEVHGCTNHAVSTEGLRVKNANGNDWYTRCDGQLFLTSPAKAPMPPELELPAEAVARSLGEVLDVYYGDGAPQGVFAATYWVAFPHPDHPWLCTKFRRDDTELIDRLKSQIEWYAELPVIGARVSVDLIRACFGHLPEAMATLRQAVAADLAKSPELGRRLAASYVEAYKNIDADR